MSRNQRRTARAVEEPANRLLAGNEEVLGFTEAVESTSFAERTVLGAGWPGARRVAMLFTTRRLIEIGISALGRRPLGRIRTFPWDGIPAFKIEDNTLEVRTWEGKAYRWYLRDLPRSVCGGSSAAAGQPGGVDLRALEDPDRTPPSLLPLRRGTAGVGGQVPEVRRHRAHRPAGGATRHRSSRCGPLLRPTARGRDLLERHRNPGLRNLAAAVLGTGDLRRIILVVAAGKRSPGCARKPPQRLVRPSAGRAVRRHRLGRRTTLAAARSR